MHYKLKEALLALEVEAGNAERDMNITDRRFRLSRLAHKFEAVRRAINEAYPIDHKYVPKARPDEIMAELISNKNWVDISVTRCMTRCSCAICRDERDHYVFNVLKRQLKTASFVRTWQRYGNSSNYMACAPKWAALLAKHEPHLLKKYAHARAATKRTLVFEMEARYGEWSK